MKWILVAIIIMAGLWVLLAKRGDAAPTAIPPPPETDFAIIGTLVDTPLIQEISSSNPKLFRLAVIRGEDGLDAISKLDVLGQQQGWHAVFIGSEEDRLDPREFGDEDPAKILDQAENIDAEAFLRKRTSEASEEIGPQELLGEWLDQNAARTTLPERYSAFRNVLTGKFHDRVYLALVPTDEAWKAPAYLQNGNWNDVPTAAEQVSVLRYWHDKYGAKLRTFSRDVMELEVAHPPQSRDQALDLAKQQFGFCHDIVYQGAGALRPLASGLEHADHWYFWWD